MVLGLALLSNEGMDLKNGHHISSVRCPLTSSKTLNRGQHAKKRLNSDIKECSNPPSRQSRSHSVSICPDPEEEAARGI